MTRKRFWVILEGHLVELSRRGGINPRARVTLAPNDEQFRRDVIARYETPARRVSSSETAIALDQGLARSHETVWALCFQLHLLIEELAKTRAKDVASETKTVLQDLLGNWKTSILARPRMVAAG